MSKIPGVFWSGLMVALPLLAVWLETNFGAYAWVPAVAGLLLIIVKVVGVLLEKAPVAPAGVMAMSQPTVAPPSRAQRIFWGG